MSKQGNNRKLQKSASQKRGEKRIKKAFIAEGILFSLFIIICVKNKASLLEILSAGKYIVGVIVSVIVFGCTITGLNITKIIEHKEEHPKLFAMWENILKNKHCIIISLISILNICLIAFIVYSTLTPNIDSIKKQPETNVAQIPNERILDDVIISDNQLPTLSPEIILTTNNAKSMEIPRAISGLYLNVIDENQVDFVDSVSEVQLLSKENKECLKSQIHRYLHKKCDTGTQPSNEEINRNKEFVEYTQEANRLTEILDEIGMDELVLLDIIDFRTKAYNLIQTKSIRTLLANDWYRLGEYYYKTNRTTKAHKYLLKSVELRSENIQMIKTADDEFYGSLYEIGVAFSVIGDIEGIEEETSMHASLLACCFFELSSANISMEDSEEIFFLSSYYGGATNQSILRIIDLLGDEVKRETSGTYICDSIKFYERSFEAENFNKQKDNQYEYINQVADMGLKYLRKMEIENCFSIIELEDIKNKYPHP